MFEVAGFTFPARGKAASCDRLLVGEAVMASGAAHLPAQASCKTFVADGVGLNPASALVAEALLGAIAGRLHVDCAVSEMTATLTTFNTELREAARGQAAPGATTLVGVVGTEARGLLLANAGDSEAWFFRDARLFRVNERQTMADVDGGPITSWFGGAEEGLHLVVTEPVRELRQGDVLLLCSDGLTKVLPPRRLKECLAEGKSLQETARHLEEEALAAGPDDDVSAALIRVGGGERP